MKSFWDIPVIWEMLQNMIAGLKTSETFYVMSKSKTKHHSNHTVSFITYITQIEYEGARMSNCCWCIV